MSEARDARDLRTEDDIKNGWSFPAWLSYHQGRDKAAQKHIDYENRPRPRPTMQNSGLKFGGRKIKRRRW